MLKNRIKSLISLIENTEIEEIEVSSFWGVQKIRLSKQSAANISENKSVSIAGIDHSKSSYFKTPKDAKLLLLRETGKCLVSVTELVAEPTKEDRLKTIEFLKNSSKDNIKLESEKKIDKPLEQKDNEVVKEVKAETQTTEDINYYEIKAPLVGTFYSSSKPSDPPFVNVGDNITKGQVICIIEAMKIFNDIESEISGIVHEVCAENGSPVEYDQVIIKILPE